MLPTVQYPLMAIYCIILSPQHKRRSVSVSVCQVGLRKTAPSPWSRPNSSDGSLSQNVHNVHHPPQGQRCDVPLGATVCMSVSVCVSVCVCVCVCVCMSVFPCLCLYILSVNRVASSCPWVSIDRECGICWVFLSISLCVRAGGGFVGYNKVTRWQATPQRRYLQLVRSKHRGLSARFTKTQHAMIAKSFTGRVEELISKTIHSLLGKEQNRTDDNHTQDFTQNSSAAHCSLTTIWNNAATMSQPSIFQANMSQSSISSSVNVRICCFSLSSMIINTESLCH